MVTETAAQDFAQHWVAAWNSHDLDAILSHYSPEVVLTSPIEARLLNNACGTVTGKEALRNYFKRGLEAYPNLALNSWKCCGEFPA
jgi:ketosteroid isomerase-like protein